MAEPGIEDDYAAAEIAVETRAFGIISDDSDFLCFQMGGVRVFSGKDVNTLEAREYDQVALARYLGIQPGDLPVLAALTGNDMVSAKDDLSTFHARIGAFENNNNEDPEEEEEEEPESNREDELPLLCDLCDVELNSPKQAQAHYNGRPHKKVVMSRLLEQLRNGNDQPQPPPPLQERPAVARPIETGRVSIRAVTRAVAGFPRTIGDDATYELMQMTNR